MEGQAPPQLLYSYAIQLYSVLLVSNFINSHLSYVILYIILPSSFGSSLRSFLV
jgi:hypothetical protein